MSPIIHLYLLSVMTAGTSLTMTAANWLTAWAGLELSCLAFLPIVMKDSDPRATEAATKYFVVQICAGALMVFAAWSNSWDTGSWEIEQPMSKINMILFTIALSLKLGLAPLHLWLPEVLQGMCLTTTFIACTWMKVAPFCLLFQLQLPSWALVMLGLQSVLSASWAALNQTQLRKILGYSSTAHLGWMVVVLPYAKGISLLTLMVYVFLAAAACLGLLYANATCISQLSSKAAKSLMGTIATTFTFLSLAGLPPLAGFAPKWLILQELACNGQLLSIVMMIPPTLLNILFYLRIMHSSTIHSPPNGLTSKTHWRSPEEKTRNAQAAAVMFTLTLLPAIPAFISLFF